MVPFSISVVVGIVCCELVLSAPATYYASKYDHIDVEMILNNRRMVNYYGACLLSIGPCPPDGLEFKRILPEALRTNCLRCTEKQKTVTLRTIKRLKKEYPKVWAQLQQQWDPDDFYVRRFEKTFSNRQGEPDVQTEIKSVGIATSIPDMTLEPSPIVTPSVKPETSVQLFNRFGDDDDNTISSVSTSSSISSTTRSAFTTTKQPAIERIATTTEAIKTITRITTIAPIITKSTTKITPIRPIAFRPIANFGAGIQATVKVVKSIENTVRQMASEKLKFFNRFLNG